jgi:hypothetical protein
VSARGHLVRTLCGENITEELRQAYLVLAKTYLRHRAGGLEDVEGADLHALRDAVLDSESLVNLSAAKAGCEWIEADSERPGELFNQLCHMEVLLAAASALAARDLRPHLCAPTQQSADTEGKAIPDLGGIGWFLEAYGGVDYGNNGKLAKDLRSLSRWSGTPSTSRLFLAFRESAWHRKVPLSALGFSPIAHSCSKKHGGPFRATAKGRLFLQSCGVLIAELRNIVIVEESQSRSQ